MASTRRTRSTRRTCEICFYHKSEVVHCNDCKTDQCHSCIRKWCQESKTKTLCCSHELAQELHDAIKPTTQHCVIDADTAEKRTKESKKRTCRHCPRCNVVIYRSKGCDSMKCARCDYRFDWTHAMRYADNVVVQDANYVRERQQERREADQRRRQLHEKRYNLLFIAIFITLFFTILFSVYDAMGLFALETCKCENESVIVQELPFQCDHNCDQLSHLLVNVTRNKVFVTCDNYHEEFLSEAYSDTCYKIIGSNTQAFDDLEPKIGITIFLTLLICFATLLLEMCFLPLFYNFFCTGASRASTDR